MLSGALARRYSRALFEIASEGAFDKIEADLKELTQFIENNEEVARVLHHPHVSMTEKKNLMDKLLGDDFSETVRNFLYLLIDRRRQDLLPLIQSEFSHLADEKRQIVEAKVASVSSLTPSQEERLQTELSRITGKKVKIVSELRPELIGGVLVQIGDLVMDGTIAHSLNRMREDLRKNSEREPQGIGVK